MSSSLNQHHQPEKDTDHFSITSTSHAEGEVVVAMGNVQIEDTYDEEGDEEKGDGVDKDSDDDDYYYHDHDDNCICTTTEQDEYCLQYRYDMLELEHESLKGTLERCEDTLKTQDKKIDFLVTQLGIAWKESERLRRLLGKEKEKNQKEMINCVVTRKDETILDVGENEEKVESGDPFDIFPEEVWAMVFDLLREPKDVENCYKTCLDFQNLLEDRKSFFLFPKIFKLVDSKYQFSTTDLLNCRLVSTVWKNIADYALQSRDYRYNFHYLNEHEYNRSEKFNYTFEDPTVIRAYKKGSEYLETFLSHLNSNFYSSPLDSNIDRSTWSPAPSRHLIIQDNDIPNLPYNPVDMEMGNYRQPTFSLLEKVGIHIWFLDIWIYISLTPCEWYTTMLDWLFHTPNVKVLQFSYPCGDDQDKTELELLVTSRPFPCLKNLVMLTMENVPMIITNSALQANKHIEMLQILRPDLEREFEFGRDLLFDNQLLNQLQNLKKISLTICGGKEFEQFENLTWPRMETINVKIGGTFTTWERIFSALNRFQRSLTTLNLKLARTWKPFFVWNEDKSGNVENSMLHLSKLKRLRLSFVDHTPIDFILPMSSLEDLYVHVDHMDYEEALKSDKIQVANGQIIKFNEFYERLQDSNILDALPTLKKVYVAVRDVNYGFPICRRYTYNRMVTRVVNVFR